MLTAAHRNKLPSYEPPAIASGLGRLLKRRGIFSLARIRLLCGLHDRWGWYRRLSRNVCNQLTTYKRCVTFQNSEGHIYKLSESCNHARLSNPHFLSNNWLKAKEGAKQATCHPFMCTCVHVFMCECNIPVNCLTFRHRASSIYDRHFATLQRTLFIYLINKYISLSDIC